jgi:hypothetical protein
MRREYKKMIFRGWRERFEKKEHIYGALAKTQMESLVYRVQKMFLVRSIFTT